MGPLRLRACSWAFSLFALGCSANRNRPIPTDVTVILDEDSAAPTFCPGTDAHSEFDGSPVSRWGARVSLPVSVPCERGFWCWESPTGYGVGFSDGLAESPTSVWLAGIEPGALVHYDGARWSITRLPAEIPLTTFSDGRSRGRWVWGSSGSGDAARSALFRRTDSGWQAARLPNNETPVAISESDSTAVAVSAQNHLFVLASDATEWSDVTPELPTSPAEQLRDACVTIAGTLVAVSSPAQANRAHLWQNTGATSRDWTQRPLDYGDSINVLCPREGAPLTVARRQGVLDAPATALAVQWTHPCPTPFASVPWTLRGVLETSANQIVVGHHQWTSRGFVARDRSDTQSWIDTDPTFRLTVAREDVAPPGERLRGSTVLLDAFDDGALLFVLNDPGGVRVRSSDGQWSTGPSEAIHAASVSNANVLWIAQANGEVRRLEFAADGALVQRGEPIPAVWTSAPSIAFDENDRGWEWMLPTSTVQRWPGNGTTLERVSIGATAIAITSDRSGGLWVIDEEMHVRRCRDSACEDTGRTLPLAARTPVTARGAVDGTLWVRSALGLLALEPTGQARMVLAGSVGAFNVARDGTAYVSTARGIIAVRSDATAREPVRPPTAIDAVYASSTGELWISTESTHAIASLRR